MQVRREIFVRAIDLLYNMRFVVVGVVTSTSGRWPRRRRCGRRALLSSSSPPPPYASPHIFFIAADDEIRSNPSSPSLPTQLSPTPPCNRGIEQSLAVTSNQSSVWTPNGSEKNDRSRSSRSAATKIKRARSRRSYCGLQQWTLRRQRPSSTPSRAG